MSFSFKYKSVLLPSGDRISRPMIPLTIGRIPKMDIIAILDSGSDITIIPKEIAKEIGIEYSGENELSGITGNPIKVKEGKMAVVFGRDREHYNFEVPILVPIEQEDVSIIIGRAGFFDQFKITFIEAEKKIEFKKFGAGQIRY